MVTCGGMPPLDATALICMKRAGTHVCSHCNKPFNVGDSIMKKASGHMGKSRNTHQACIQKMYY